MVIEVVSLIISVLLAPLNAKKLYCQSFVASGVGTTPNPLYASHRHSNTHKHIPYHHTPNNPTQGNTAPHRG